MPVGPHILANIEEALSECFKFHNELDAFMLRVGYPAERLSRARQRAATRPTQWSSTPKRFVVQEILLELQGASAEDVRLVAAIVTALTRTKFPYASTTGLEAIERLKVDIENDRKAAESQRNEAEKLRQENEQRKRDIKAAAASNARHEFRQRFLSLTGLSDAQQRGYQLEKFLNEFMEFEGLSPRGSFRIVGEQIDGSFSWSSRTHLVEAKWVTEPVNGASFGAFNYKLDGKTADTRGLFLSINGYSVDAIKSLNSKGSLRFICIDGAHIIRATDPGWDMQKLLRIVWRHADETGDSYLPVSASGFISRS